MQQKSPFLLNNLKVFTIFVLNIFIYAITLPAVFKASCLCLTFVIFLLEETRNIRFLFILVIRYFSAALIAERMRTNQVRKTYSTLFLSVFFLKMAISVAPIYASFYDSKHVIAAILQLEIENNSGKPNCVDSSTENFTKEFATTINWDIFITPSRFLAVKQYPTDDDISVKSFYPSVPTPPPNC